MKPHDRHEFTYRRGVPYVGFSYQDLVSMEQMITTLWSTSRCIEVIGSRMFSGADRAVLLLSLCTKDFFLSSIEIKYALLLVLIQSFFILVRLRLGYLRRAGLDSN